MRRPKLVLLDRDGVINFDSPDYILAPEQWLPIPGSLEAIARLCKAGIEVAVCSNQSGLGRGMMSQETFDAIHAKMLAMVETAGGKFAHVAYCPHAPEANCDCRKPKPGMVHEILQSLGFAGEASETLFIGDSTRDVEAAHAANVAAVLVQSGYGDAASILEKCRRIDPEIRTFPDLAAAVDALLAGEDA